MTSRLIFFEFSRQTHPIMAKRIWLLNISIAKITQINFSPPTKNHQPFFPTQTKHFCCARKKSTGFTQKTPNEAEKISMAKASEVGFQRPRTWSIVVGWFDFFLGGGFKIFLFHPYLGKIPILTNIFQRG